MKELTEKVIRKKPNKHTNKQTEELQPEKTWRVDKLRKGETK